MSAYIKDDKPLDPNNNKVIKWQVKIISIKV